MTDELHYVGPAAWAALQPVPPDPETEAAFEALHAPATNGAVAHDDLDEDVGEWEPPEEVETMTAQPRRVPDIDAFLNEPEPEYDWLIPGLLEHGDRLILTGFEGKGKSTLLRQASVQMAAGLHPFTLEPIEPVGVLYLDLENSRRQFRRKIRPLRLQAGDMDPANLHIDMRPEGIDLHDASVVDELRHELDSFDVDVLILGPLYKLASGDPNDEKVAKPIAMTLDALRAEFGVAVLMEAHSGHAAGGTTRRPERPFGASLWMRWPEFGVFLDEFGELRHWRGARDERAWPAALKRGGAWPWTPVLRGEEPLPSTYDGVTNCRDALLKFFEDHIGEEFSTRKLQPALAESGVKHGTDLVRDTANRLVDEGLIGRRDGPRGSKLFSALGSTLRPHGLDWEPLDDWNEEE